MEQVPLSWLESNCNRKGFSTNGSYKEILAYKLIFWIIKY